jgi:hypothetical protein
MYRSAFFETFFADTEVEHPDMPEEASVAGLQGQVQTLTRNLFDLQLVVASLIETLHKIELADPVKLRETVEEELGRVRTSLAAKAELRAAEQRAAKQDREAARHASGQPQPSIGHQAVQGSTTCAKCGKTVPSGRTTITATGTICDLCAAGLPPA